MSAARIIQPPQLAPTPWRCLPRGGGHGRIGLALTPAVYDANGRSIATLMRPNDVITAELMTMAPEALAHLVALVFQMCRLDPEFCRDNGTPIATSDDLAEALADALALIAHAKDLGVLPKEPQS